MAIAKDFARNRDGERVSALRALDASFKPNQHLAGVFRTATQSYRSVVCGWNVRGRLADWSSEK